MVQYGDWPIALPEVEKHQFCKVMMVRGTYVLNEGQVTAPRCGGEREVFARFQSGCECSWVDVNVDED